MAAKISPISGFPEYLPAQQLAFNALTSKIRAVYESFGYVPLETPAVERIDTLVSKGIDSKEVYALRRLNTQGEGDDGAKDLALKFDLTVPLARYVSQHYANLTFPFRRYQMQPVWRGERTQKGRERQFYQFDLDYIAENTLPLAADAEVIAAAHTALTQILPSGVKFRMRLNNRRYLQSLISSYSITDVPAAIKIIDNIEKVTPEATLEAFASANLCTAEVAAQLIAELKSGHLNPTLDGAADLQQVFDTVQNLTRVTSHESRVTIDLTIARGLDYYTGTVLETVLVDAPKFGSICSGGRYENLAESLSDRKLPGVGVSIGITRLMEWLLDLPQFQNLAATTAQVFIPLPSASPEDLQAATKLAANLRAAGLSVEQSLHAQSLPDQYKKADKRGLKYAALPQPDGRITLRTFATRTNEENLTPADIALKIK